MALRLYTRVEFEKALQNELGMTPTEEYTELTRAWKTRKGHFITVPKNGINVLEQGERFPDNWLAEIYKQVERLDGKD